MCKVVWRQGNSFNYQQWQTLWTFLIPNSIFLPLCYCREGVSGNHSPECLFSDWISPYLLFLYWSPKALGFTEMHKVEEMINVSQTKALVVRMPASSQRCYCSCRRLCLTLSHPSRGFPKQSVYVLSATLHGLQGLMGCEREPGVFHLVFSCTNTLHLPPVLRV